MDVETLATHLEKRKKMRNLANSVGLIEEALNFHGDVYLHVERIQELVQNNQWFFRNPPAGTSKMNTAANRLEELIQLAKTTDCDCSACLSKRDQA